MGLFGKIANGAIHVVANTTKTTTEVAHKAWNTATASASASAAKNVSVVKTGVANANQTAAAGSKAGAASTNATSGPQAKASGSRRAYVVDNLAKKGNPNEIAAALQGKNSALGQMNDAEKRHLVSASLDTWDNRMKGWHKNYGEGVKENLKNSETLLNAVGNDKNLTNIVKSEMAKKPLNIVMFYNNHESTPDSAFDKAALTYGRQNSSDTDIYIPFKTKEDFKDGWNQLSASGRSVSNVAYFGHAGEGWLGFARTTPDDPNSQLSNKDISQLGRLNYAHGAKIDLHACQTADGKKTVAQQFAESQGVPAVGRNGHAVFSTNTFYFHESGDKSGGNIDANWKGELYLESFYRGTDNMTDAEVIKEMPMLGSVGLLGPLLARNVAVPTTTFNPPQIWQEPAPHPSRVFV